MFHNNIRILGKVCGVFFREGAKEKANEFDITGYIKNLSDRSVYVEIEGESENLKKFINWCHKGPDAAEVEKVEVEEGSLENFKQFIVK